MFSDPTSNYGLSNDQSEGLQKLKSLMQELSSSLPGPSSIHTTDPSSSSSDPFHSPIPSQENTNLDAMVKLLGEAKREEEEDDDEEREREIREQFLNTFPAMNKFEEVNRELNRKGNDEEDEQRQQQEEASPLPDQLPEGMGNDVGDSLETIKQLDL
jgi:hypothetical protein